MKRTPFFTVIPFIGFALVGSVLIGCDSSQTASIPPAEGKKGKILAPGEKSGDVQIRINK